MNDGSMNFKLTPRESEAVSALKAACEANGVEYKSTFELAKYALVSHSCVDDKDPRAKEKRVQIALKRVKQKRECEARRASLGADAVPTDPQPKKATHCINEYYSVFVSGEFCLVMNEERLKWLIDSMPVLGYLLLDRPEAPKQAADGTLNFKLELSGDFGISKDNFLYLVNCVLGLLPLPALDDARYRLLVEAVTKLGGCPSLEAKLDHSHADPPGQVPRQVAAKQRSVRRSLEPYRPLPAKLRIERVGSSKEEEEVDEETENTESVTSFEEEYQWEYIENDYSLGRAEAWC